MISEKEMNRILDKINESGINSLTVEEIRKLKSFSVDSKQEVETNFKNQEFKLKDENQLEKIKTNLDVVADKLISNIYILIKTDKFIVGLDKFSLGTKRTYFIRFFEIKERKNRIICLKLVYNLNKTVNNIEFYDNHNNLLDFNKLQFLLEENGLQYKTFNDSWFYIEDDYINR
jgi:L-rhamnose isomerase